MYFGRFRVVANGNYRGQTGTDARGLYCF